ncbi:hypothetical protein ACFL23_03495 [Patescibacteria group bacterium]
MNKYYRSINEKTLFVGLIFLGLSSLMFAFFQLKYSLISPFSNNQIENSDEIMAEKEDDIFLLQKMDSDNDGLTDYDELYVYETSPYLEDSDSDGYNDKLEIESSNNPNCPQNKNCQLYLDEGYITASTSASLILPYDETTAADIANIPDMDIDALREMLLSSGMPIEILSQIDDETLMDELLQISEEEF